MFRPPLVHHSAIRNRKVHIWHKVKEEKEVDESLLCRENLHEYTDQTTLHGLKYIGNRSLAIIERIFFAFSFVLVFLLSIYFISNVWTQWTTSPVVITLSAQSKSIENIPFPAVTLCNMNKVQKSAIEKLSTNELEYTIAKSLCQQNLDGSKIHLHHGNWDQLRTVLLKVAQPCTAMLLACRWDTEEYDCSDLFNSVITDEGACCVFNGIHKGLLMKYNTSGDIHLNEDHKTGRAIFWTPEHGFSIDGSKRNKFHYPRPAIGTGIHHGLSLVLNVDAKEYYCSTRSSYGFKVRLHSPNELPKVAHYGMSVGRGFETFISVTPVLSEAAENTHHIPINTRQCLFEEESFLTLFRSYSRQNCKLESQVKTYLDRCNCIRYYMPKFEPNIPLCRQEDVECIEEITSKTRARNFTNDCLQSCFSLDYRLEVSMSPLNRKSQIFSNKHFDKNNVVVLHIFFREQHFRSQIKEEIVSFSDFLSNVGGLLGLFMGFSFFSIIELVYFISIRPYYDHIRVHGKHGKAIQHIAKKMRNTFSFKNKSDNTDKRNKDDYVLYPYLE